VFNFLCYKRDANQNNTDFISAQLGWPESRVITTTSAGDDVVTRQLLYTAGGNANQYNHSGKQYGDCSKN
jgi:hypothetical protein